MRAFIAIIGLALAVPQAAHADAFDVPNTIPCQDFRKNFDGSWTANSNTPAFDIARLKDYRLESNIIQQGEFDVGGVDLWAVITKKCPG